MAGCLLHYFFTNGVYCILSVSIMTVQKLIDQYNKKIAMKDKAIAKISEMIREARHGETSSDIEDLLEEKANAQRDRQLYFQFTKDLEDLL